MSNTFRSWIRRCFKMGGGRKPFRHSLPLALEPLEDRVVPTVTALPDLYGTTAGTMLLASTVLANDSTSGNSLLTASLLTSPTNGSVTFMSDGTFSYLPDSSFSGSDSFQYTVSDGTDSALQLVTINVVSGTSVGVPPGNTSAYGAYLSAVDQANQTYLATVNMTLAGRDALVASAQAACHSAYLDYLSTLQGAYQTFLSTRESAAQVYDTTMAAALQTMQTAQVASLATYEDAVAAAEFALADSATVADEAYETSVDAATAIYNSTVNPYQLARDTAYNDLQADPSNTSLQAVLSAAEQALTGIVATASSVRDASVALAQGIHTSTLQAATQVRDSAIQAALVSYQSSLQSPLTALDNAESAAWATLQAAGATAKSVFLSAEQTAWTAYADSFNQANSSLAVSLSALAAQAEPALAAALATWQAAELSAWNAYLAALNAPGSMTMPEPRVTAPPPLKGLLNTSLSMELRDPQGFVGSTIPEWVPRNRATYAAAAAGTAAMIAAGAYVINRAASESAMASVRQSVMAELSGFGGANPNPLSRGNFQYGGAVRIFADSLGVNLATVADRFKTELESRGFSNVVIADPVAFIRYSINQPQLNPRNGWCTFTVAFRVRVTATPPGGGAATTLEMPAGTVSGDFRDNRLRTMTLRPS